jgi:hypothetical protein
VVILNFQSNFPPLSEHIIEELTALVVHNPALVVVDRRNLELLQQKMNFQYSGEVAGEINGNTASSSYGGGVYIGYSSSFTKAPKAGSSTSESSMVLMGAPA